MKEESYARTIGSIEARLDNVEEKLKEVPTRPELEMFTQALNNLIEIQKEQSEQIRTFNDYVNRWKGAAIVLVAIGAMLTKVVDIVMNFLGNHNPS